jgi:hypothetical protein
VNLRYDFQQTISFNIKDSCHRLSLFAAFRFRDLVKPQAEAAQLVHAEGLTCGSAADHQQHHLCVVEIRASLGTSVQTGHGLVGVSLGEIDTAVSLKRTESKAFQKPLLQRVR